jgi:cytochrome c oxidase cbb3-type subunit 3
MQKQITLIIGISLSLLGAVGCQKYSSPGTAAVSLPTHGTAVGPIPGAGKNVAFPTNPLANDPVALQEGRKLFNWYNCSGCHGGHAGGGMGPSLRDKVWLFGDRDDQIFDSIAEGRGEGMPSWGTKIPEDQIWKLVAYIKSMRTSEEPEPPEVPAHEQVAPPAIIHPNQSTKAQSTQKD